MTDLLTFLRKEVIQPHLPVRLPCYDFTPVTNLAIDGSPITDRPPASGATDSRGVTGGVYKARERIHRSFADLRLLAIPTSCSRVADCNLGSTFARMKLKGIDGGPHKRWSTWFNSMLTEEPYLGLTSTEGVSSTACAGPRQFL